MKYKKCTDPKVFGFGILLPIDKILPSVKKYEKKIKPYIEWGAFKEKHKKGSNLMPLHIAIKYLGYHKNYSNKEIKKLLPELKEICEKYLPIEIIVRGLKIGTKYDNIGILLNYKTDPKVKRFHNEILKKFNGRIDIFENQDGKNFSQHITLAAAKKTNKNLIELRKIAKESKKDKPIRLKCNEAYIFFKEGPKTIYHKK